MKFMPLPRSPVEAMLNEGASAPDLFFAPENLASFE